MVASGVDGADPGCGDKSVNDVLAFESAVVESDDSLGGSPCPLLQQHLWKWRVMKGRRQFQAQQEVRNIGTTLLQVVHMSLPYTTSRNVH